jgi:peptidoglycan/xylan/chitin deacetylase (PgdA/CDA1 family)
MVPCAWPLDHGRITESVARGHEVGVHGYNHANQTPFLPAEERKPRLVAGRAFGDRYGAVGYRAPSLLRTAALLSDVDGLYGYDSSIPASGGPFPVPNNGCASARPWKIGRLWEIPLTLPRDGSLRFLGHSPRQIGAMWRSVAETVSASGGIVSLLTHCEVGFSGNLPMLGAYREFLEWVAGDARFKFMRPRDLLERLEMQGGP